MMSTMKDIHTDATCVAYDSPEHVLALATFLDAGGHTDAAVLLLELLPTVCYSQQTECRDPDSDTWYECGDDTGMMPEPFPRLTVADALDERLNYLPSWHARNPRRAYRIATYIASDEDITLGILIDSVEVLPEHYGRA